MPSFPTWHLDKVRFVMGGRVHWLWRADDEHGEVLDIDILLQTGRDTAAAKRFFKRLLDVNNTPKQVIMDGLRSYGAALKEVPELTNAEHVSVSSEERQNNLIEQSHRPTRDQERQQRGLRNLECTQRFLFRHAHISNLFRGTKARLSAEERRYNLKYAFVILGEVSLQIT